MNDNHCPTCATSRRTFLSDLGMGFTGLALGSMLHRDGISRASELTPSSPTDGQHHLAPKAKSVIWIFLSGGYSQLETFDPKPALNRYAGMTFEDTPLANPLESPLHDKRSRAVVEKVREKFAKIYPLQIGYRKRGELGIEVTDWWPHLSTCVDDISFVRNMWTTDNDHAAENQIHTGRHKLDETQPSIGAWVTYGLGSQNENLPQFVVLGGPTRADTKESIDSYYLGPKYAGIPLALDPNNPLPYGRRSNDVLAAEQRNEFELAGKLNRLAAIEYPEDEAVKARIKSYELAFNMQMAVPEAIGSSRETTQCQQLYGLDDANTKVAGERLLAARRLVERGVRFVQVYPSPYGVWDSHRALKKNHASQISKVDKPVAGLLKDLKRRGMLDDVVVVFCTEFGRTPAVEERGGGTDGRDHHPHGFTVWFAGAGVKRGHIHGATDELGFHAIEPGHYVTDMHATVLHLMGLDGRRLEVPSRKRLDMDYGKPITEILS
ncbi:MAG: sulfatase [Planctomycetaceae bacterium]|nr:sulfatase [Planctomycetaceae bacterium]